MLAVLIALTPACRNEIIDSQKAKVRIAVFLTMDLQSHWNFTLELIERTYHLGEFTPMWLQSPNYSEYRPLFTTHDEWMIVKYVREVLRPF
jgi:hypothetical protein